jgi:hypothetical protein
MRRRCVMESDKKVLTYQPKLVTHRSRRVRRAIFFLAMVVVLLWNSAAIKNAAMRVRARWLVRQCENFELPPDTVVFESDPNLARAYATNSHYQWINVDPPYLIRDVPPLTDFPWEPRSASVWNQATFCHSRTSKSGHRRLVVVDGDMNGTLVATVIDPGSFMVPPKEISTTGIDTPRPWPKYEVLTTRRWGPLSWISDNNPIYTLYAGQPDRNDASHFTFRYVAKGGAGTIDGWLLDNDKVRFRALDGPYGHPLNYFIRMEKEFDD